MSAKYKDRFTIICPYMNQNDIIPIKHFLGREYSYIFRQDTAQIGSDLMYQKLWKECTNDIFILHADMVPSYQNFGKDLLEYVDKYREAGIFGCKLLYPTEEKIIQSAGGKFTDGNPDHFGSGLVIETGNTFKDELLYDSDDLNKVYEVAWTTFGGVYIRREVLDKVGDFDMEFEWSYNRDVDYCLSARKAGWKIYQIPIEIIHHESMDNKRLRQVNSSLNAKESRNLQRLKNKWENTEFYSTIFEEVYD